MPVPAIENEWECGQGPRRHQSCNNSLTPHRPSPWCANAARLLIIPAVFLVTACHTDSRISLAEMAELEEQALAGEPVGIEPQKLALTEFQPYKVRPGDILTIQMTGLMEDRYALTSLQVRVHQDGRISLPIVGFVDIAGLDLGQAEETIIEAHVPQIVKDLAVYVQLVRLEATTVLVLGAVAKPGLVPLGENERNVLYALASAGGFSFSGSGRVRLKPISPEREEVVYNLSDVNDVRRALLAPPLASGDILEVEAADSSVVYLTGLLNAPGPIPVPPQKTMPLTRAVAAAGGVVDLLQPKEATLWRTLPDGQQVRARVDIASILDGESPDLALRAGDILDVPHTADTRFRMWFAQNIRLGPFGITAMYDPVADYRARILRDRDNDGNLFRQSFLYTLGSGIPEVLIPPVTAP